MRLTDGFPVYWKTVILPTNMEDFLKTSLMVTVQSFQTFLICRPSFTFVQQGRDDSLVDKNFGLSPDTAIIKDNFRDICRQNQQIYLVLSTIVHVYFLGKAATQVGGMLNILQRLPSNYNMWMTSCWIWCGLVKYLGFNDEKMKHQYN